jgi:phage FluMu gp28-like protein
MPPRLKSRDKVALSAVAQSGGSLGNLTEVKPLKPATVKVKPVSFRKYQRPVFNDRTAGIIVLHWSRQIGKSFTLASWAVDRILDKLKTNDSWLVTVLSNSRDNGAEFVIKAQDVCNKLGVVMESTDDSPDLTYDNMKMEVRITVKVDGVTRVGRIKVLAANPRTARGFSGDLILDEFAFHENSAAIWEAAEPILSSNPEYLCRISSTGNGKHNMFFRMASGAGPNDGTLFKSTAGFWVCRVTRTEAWKMGVKIYDANTREPITPEQARAAALDKRAYDQNYECKFNDENMCLLTNELITQAMREGIPIDEQQWSAVSIARMYRAEGDLYLGQDVGRNRDLSVQVVGEKKGNELKVIGLLRMEGMRLPDQQKQLEIIARLPRFRKGCIDMTGLGLGLVEYAQEESWGRNRIQGINFATTEPINDFIRAEGRKGKRGDKVPTTRVTENMATALLNRFEDKSVTFEVELDTQAIEDLRKPERIVSPGGRVSIAAVRDEAGHADHFWGVALMIRAVETGNGPFKFAALRKNPNPSYGRMGMGKVKGTVTL